MALVLGVLNVWVPLPESYFISCTTNIAVEVTAVLFVICRKIMNIGLFGGNSISDIQILLKSSLYNSSFDSCCRIKMWGL